MKFQIEKYLKNYFLQREIYLVLFLFGITILAVIVNLTNDNFVIKNEANQTISEDSLLNIIANEIVRIKKDSSNLQQQSIAKQNTLNRKEININKADISQLSRLPGIGDKTAQDIIEYRKRYGKFKSIKEIMNVRRIAEKKFNKIKEYITID